MKILNNIWFIAGFLLLSYTSFGQNDPTASVTTTTKYDSYLNILKTIPDFFQSWVDKTEAIAIEQDKAKFAGIGMNIYRNLDKLIITKRNLIDVLNNNPQNLDFHIQKGTKEMIDKLSALQKSIELSSELTDKIGINAVKFAGSLSSDFNQKTKMLEYIKVQNGSTQEKVNFKLDAIKKLNSGIQILEESKLKINSFIIEMEKDG